MTSSVLVSSQSDVPAATACADVGDVDDARAHLADAERSAALWQGTAWQAVPCQAEAWAHLHRAEGDADAARHKLTEAAELFTVAGQPLDARRCLS
jgi:hypothetical protein